ncbi:MAG: oligosaccharide flippase family protein [Acidobacteriota bacterium]|nr:oligosaccharide flippase family protein [Acidobacteriota bacterium]
MSQSSPNIRGLAGSGGAVTGARIFDVGASYLFYLVLARAMAPDAFGRLVLAITIAYTVAVYARIGLDSATMRKSAEALAGGRAGVGPILRRATLVTAIGSAAAVALLWIAMVHVPAFANYRRAFAGANGLVLAALPLVAFQAVYAMTLRGVGRQRAASFGESVVQPAIALLFAIGAWIFDAPLLASGALLASMVASIVYALAKLREHWSAGGAEEDAHGLVTLGVTLAFVVGIQALAQSLDVLILGRWRGAAEVGLYAVAYKTARALVLINDSAHLVIAPAVPSLLRDNKREELQLLYRTSARWVTLTTFPGALVILIAAEPLLHIFGASFVPAAPVLRVLAATFAVFVAAGPAHPFLLMAGHQRLLVMNAVAAVIATAALLMTLVPRWGMHGAATSVLIAAVLQRALLLIEMRVVLKIVPIGARNATLLIAAAVSLVLVFALGDSGMWIAGGCAIAAFATGVAMCGFDSVDRDVFGGVVDAFALRRRA